MLAAPEVTPYDLRFRLLDVPVRVHPMFWLVMLLISGHPEHLKAALIFTACAFVSVLVHEFGHGLASRAVGNEPSWIVLYAMGGLCQSSAAERTLGDRLFVLLMGPGAGFLLLTAGLAVANGVYGVRPVDALALVGVGPGDPGVAAEGLGLFRRATSWYVFESLLRINFYWNLVSLFPIWPLDGGQAVGAILQRYNPFDGARWTFTLSLLTAGGLGIWAASRHDYFLALWFGYFAFGNYQQLQGPRRYGDRGGW